jgi:hypothetical protein
MPELRVSQWWEEPSYEHLGYGKGTSAPLGLPLPSGYERRQPSAPSAAVQMALGAAGTAAAAASALRQRVARLIRGERKVKALERRGAPAAVVGNAEESLVEQLRETKMAFKKVLAQNPGVATERGVREAKHAFKQVEADIEARHDKAKSLIGIFERKASKSGLSGPSTPSSWQAEQQRPTSQTLGGRTLLTAPKKWTATPLSGESSSSTASTPTSSSSSTEHFYLSGPKARRPAPRPPRHSKVGDISYHRIDSDSD